MTHAQLCRLGIGIPVDPVLPLVEDVLGYVRDDALAAVLAARVAFHLHTVPVPICCNYLHQLHLQYASTASQFSDAQLQLATTANMHRRQGCFMK